MHLSYNETHQKSLVSLPSDRTENPILLKKNITKFAKDILRMEFLR